MRESTGGGLFDAAEEAGGPLELRAPLAATHPDVQVVARIGAGGMGVVYRVAAGRETQAVKVLRPALRHIAEARQRFALEQALLERLDHKGIVGWIDNGITDDGLPFVRMQWIDGVRLDELPRGTFLRAQVDLVQQLADTLTYLHAEQVAHRVLKGGNILVERGTNRAVLCDFGIARDLAQPTSLASALGTPGTPGYGPPDAVHTERTDVWSLAALFYELYAGRPPVAGHYEPPSAAGYPVATDAVLAQGWAHDPAKRYPTPRAFAEALNASLDGAGPTVASSHPSPRAPSPSPGVSPPARTNTGQQAPAREYVAGRVPLPFDCIAIKVLHDQVTAIVGGVDGSIAAIDLRTGQVLAQARAEDSTRAHWGGGEIHYPRDAYLLLELAPKRQCFYTMSHAGVLNTWMFDGQLRHLTAVSLLSVHAATLREEIVKARGRSGWSYWTCYSRDIPAEIPGAIMEAKLSIDGSSIVCLTDWFAIFRCDLAGRLREPPRVIADAFAIEPASADAAEVWVGRGSGLNSLHRLSFKHGAVSATVINATFGMEGIQTLSSTAMLAGGRVLRIPEIQPAENADLWAIQRYRARVLLGSGCVLYPNGSIVRAYDLETFRHDGEPLFAGHAGDVTAVDATSDEKYVVSIDARSLRVWDFETRCPVGGYPPERTMLRHGLANERSDRFATIDGSVYVPTYEAQAIVIDMAANEFSRVACDPNVMAAGATNNETHLVSVETRIGPHAPGVKGLLSRALRIQPDKELQLRHEVIRSRRALLQATVPFNGPHARLRYWEPDHNNSVGVDLGDGRLALLIAGHLALYDLSRRCIIAGPIDVSGPALDADRDDTSWRYYTQMVGSLDGSMLFLRGRGRPIKVFSADSLTPMGEIRGSAGHLGHLIPWTDSQHVLFSTKVVTDEELRFRTREVLAIADARSAQVLGELCPISWYVRQAPHHAVVLQGGSVLAVANGVAIQLIDLFDGGSIMAEVGSHSDMIYSLHLCPNGHELMSTAADGTARFWDLTPYLGDHLADRVDVLANVKLFSLDLVDVPR